MNKLKIIGLSLVITGLIHIGYKTTDNQGYIRSHSLYELFFPEIEGAYRYTDIKSLQTGSCVTNGGTGLCSITLGTAVVRAASLVFPNGMTSSTVGTVFNTQYTADLTTTTNINIVEESGNATVAVSVQEYYPVVLTAGGVQRGLITLNNVTSNTATLSPAVVTAKTMLVSCGQQSGAGVTPASAYFSGVVTNTTTVTASVTTASAGTANKYCWQTIEFIK